MVNFNPVISTYTLGVIRQSLDLQPLGRHRPDILTDAGTHKRVTVVSFLFVVFFGKHFGEIPAVWGIPTFCFAQYVRLLFYSLARVPQLASSGVFFLWCEFLRVGERNPFCTRLVRSFAKCIASRVFAAFAI